MSGPIFIRALFRGADKRLKTFLLLVAGVVACLAPSLTYRGWLVTGGVVVLLVSCWAIWDALDLSTVYRDVMATRRAIEDVERKVAERRRARIVGRIGQ